jgi:hypothetical protein
MAVHRNYPGRPAYTGNNKQCPNCGGFKVIKPLMGCSTVPLRLILFLFILFGVGIVFIGLINGSPGEVLVGLLFMAPALPWRLAVSLQKKRRCKQCGFEWKVS